jgi:hypothetical protein
MSFDGKGYIRGLRGEYGERKREKVCMCVREREREREREYRRRQPTSVTLPPAAVPARSSP